MNARDDRDEQFMARLMGTEDANNAATYLIHGAAVPASPVSSADDEGADGTHSISNSPVNTFVQPEAGDVHESSGVVLQRPTATAAAPTASWLASLGFAGSPQASEGSSLVEETTYAGTALSSPAAFSDLDDSLYEGEGGVSTYSPPQQLIRRFNLAAEFEQQQQSTASSSGLNGAQQFVNTSTQDAFGNNSTPRNRPSGSAQVVGSPVRSPLTPGAGFESDDEEGEGVRSFHAPAVPRSFRE
jgi:hypothetical protein